MLPNTIAEIGGSRLYAWVTTLYLVGSVVAATMVNPLLLRVGPRSCYLMGLAVFGVSSLVCGAAPNMEILIAGRALQGVAGGLLAGLGYAVINAALPPLVVDAGFGTGVGNVGRRDGGWANDGRPFRAVRVMAMGLCRDGHSDRSDGHVGTGRAGPRRSGPAVPAMKVPIWSLLLIGAAALAVSVAQIPHNTVATFGLLAAGIVLVGLFVVVDWRMHAAILPPSVFGPGPLKWIYLTMGVLMGAAMVTTYVPLFGQRLAHLTPIAAGFLGAALALGWTVSEIVSASLENPRAIGRVVMVAPMVVASGLALGAVARHGDGSAPTAALWAVGCC